MTNEVIIDEIDVSKCEYFDMATKDCKAEHVEWCGYEFDFYYECFRKPDCDYKQKQRGKGK